MNRKKLLILFALLICSGCSANHNTEEHNSQNYITQTTYITEDDGGEVLDSYKEFVIKEITSEPPNKYDIFTGTDKDTSPLNTINNKEFSPSIFCFDNDNVYFSWDGSIYSYSETDCALEKLIDANAYSLNFYKGKIYYIENHDYKMSRDKMTLVKGPLYCYDINSNTNTKICDNNISMPMICDNGIFCVKYSSVGDPLPTGIYRIDEESNIIERVCNGFSYIEYNNLIYSYIPVDNENNNIKFYFKQGDTALILDEVRSRKESLLDDNLYYISRDDGSLNSYSLITGENAAHIVYDHDFFTQYYPEIADELAEDYSGDNDKLSLSDYTVFKGDIWFYGVGLNRYNETEDKTESYYADFIAHSLYSSNNAMYAIISEQFNGKEVFHFGKISISGNTAEVDVIK